MPFRPIEVVLALFSYISYDSGQYAHRTPICNVSNNGVAWSCQHDKLGFQCEQLWWRHLANWKETEKINTTLAIVFAAEQSVVQFRVVSDKVASSSVLKSFSYETGFYHPRKWTSSVAACNQ